MAEKNKTGSVARVAGPSKNTSDVGASDHSPARVEKRPLSVPVDDLVLHANNTAGSVRSALKKLVLAKITAADATALEAGAARLRSAEEDWLAKQRGASPGTLAACRTPLLAGRNLLFRGIDAFVEEKAARKELRSIGGVDNDSDLESDTTRLIALARKHSGDLAGTKVTPEKVNATETALVAFRAARAGAALDGPTKADLVLAANTALAARDAAFWSLMTLDQRICKRARFQLDDDPTTRREFASPTTLRTRGVKKAATTRRRKAAEKAPADTTKK